MALVNLDQTLTEFDGATPLMDISRKGYVCEKCGHERGSVMEPIVLNKVCFRALISTYVDERGLSGEEKYERSKLAEKVLSGGIVELEANDVSLIKKLIGKAYSAMIVGQAWDMLEGRIIPPEKQLETEVEEELTI